MSTDRSSLVHTREYKLSGGRIYDAASTGVSSVTTTNGVEVGRFSGMLATYEPDQGGCYGVPDVFKPGAFARSIAEHKSRGGRSIRLKYQHQTLIGQMPIADVFEDAKGLHVVGEVNLSTALGRDVFALIRQGALSDLSIGFAATRDRMVDGGKKRLIEEAIIFEGSIVDEPAQRNAVITSVKASEPASLEGILESLQACRDTLRGRGSDQTEQTHLRAMMRDLRAMRADFRR